MKSLRSQISFNTVTSIAVISSLIIGLSIYVYEKLYVEFVSAEVNAIGENIAVDLIDFIDDPAGSFYQTEVLLRLGEYDYAETAYILDNDGNVLNMYIGPAGINSAGDTSPNSSSCQRSKASKPITFSSTSTFA